jgi:hypothetical protein
MVTLKRGGINTVVIYSGETKENGLTYNKPYAVETDVDLVEYYEFCVTVCDDNGHLHEIETDKYVIVSADPKDWRKAKPDKCYTEIY